MLVYCRRPRRSFVEKLQHYDVFKRGEVRVKKSDRNREREIRGEGQALVNTAHAFSWCTN